MISNTFDITNVIKKEHYIFWESNGGEILSSIIKDKSKIYKSLFSVSHFQGLGILYKERLNILFGDYNKHIKIIDKLNKIKFCQEDNVDYLTIFIQKWPYRTENGYLSFDKRRNCSNKSQLVDMLNEIISSYDDDFTKYIENLISEVDNNFSHVIDVIKRDIFLTFNFNATSTFSIKDLLGKIFNYKEFRNKSNVWNVFFFYKE